MSKERRKETRTLWYLLFVALPESLDTKCKPHHPDNLSESGKAGSRFRMPVSWQRPTKLQDYLLHVVITTTANALPVTQPEPPANFGTRPLAAEPSLERANYGGDMVDPKPVPNQTRSCSLASASPWKCLWKPSSTGLCGTSSQEPLKLRWQSWQATCDVTESGVTMASDLLMFIGNE